MGIYRGGHHRGYEKGLIKGNSSKGELIKRGTHHRGNHPRDAFASCKSAYG